jgi:hypothetical protein
VVVHPRSQQSVVGADQFMFAVSADFAELLVHRNDGAVRGCHCDDGCFVQGFLVESGPVARMLRRQNAGHVDFLCVFEQVIGLDGFHGAHWSGHRDW